MSSNCGATRYLVIRPFLSAYFCHCRPCQKRTGSAFSLSVVLLIDGLELIARYIPPLALIGAIGSWSGGAWTLYGIGASDADKRAGKAS
jgi:hypothetical protein